MAESISRDVSYFDMSHWTCVHESDLSAMEDYLTLAPQHTKHIHARVGHAEGPQVVDHRAPEWSTWLEIHCQAWDTVRSLHCEEGKDRLTITPEVGPRPYMPTIPYTNQPLADAWEMNVLMRQLLIDR